MYKNRKKKWPFIEKTEATMGNTGMRKYKLTDDLNHTHFACLDSEGNGETDDDDGTGHVHQVVQFQVMPSAGHNHALLHPQIGKCNGTGRLATVLMYLIGIFILYWMLKKVWNALSDRRDDRDDQNKSRRRVTWGKAYVKDDDHHDSFTESLMSQLEDML